MQDFTDLSDNLELQQLLDTRPPRFARATLWLVIALIVVGGIWASVARHDVVVRATGRVRPLSTACTSRRESGMDRISATFSGVATEVRVREGDRVEQGAVLVRLDTRQLEAETRAVESRLQAGRAELARLEKLREILSEEISVGLRAADEKIDFARSEQERRESQRELAVSGAERELESARRNARRAHDLAADGIVSERDVEQADSEVRRVREALDRVSRPTDSDEVRRALRAREQVEKALSLRREELEIRIATRRAELISAETSLASLSLKREGAVLRARSAGLVTRIAVAEGDLVDAGKAVAEIADGSELCVEVAVPSRDIGKLRAGMLARIKLDAYDYQRYGSLVGAVEHVSPDALVGSQAGPGVGMPISLFSVRVRLDPSASSLTEQVRLGMTGAVEIVTGEERVLASLLEKVRI